MPNALLYGVSYELFWHLNPQKLIPFRNAFQKKVDLYNQNAWLQGQYIRLAVGSVLNGKKCKYPEKPFDTRVKERNPVEDFLVWIEVFNARFDDIAK